MSAGLTLEQAAIASFSNLATMDTPAAFALLDDIGTQAQDFRDRQLALVWSAVEAMVRDNRAPDLFAVETKCPGIPRALLTLVLMSEDTAPPAERLRAVRANGQRRRMVHALDAVRAVAMDTSRPLTDAVAEAHKTLSEIQGPTNEAVTMDGELIALCDRLDEIAAGRREPVLATGIEALDAVIGGLQKTLTVIGALPGVGKSALLAATVRNLAAAGRRVGVFSLEDERSWIVERLVAEAATVPLFVLRTKPLGPQQQQRVGASIERLHGHMRTVVVDDRPAMSPSDVVTSARNMLTRHRVEALIVDHLGEIRLSRSDRHDLDIADCLQQLRALAKIYRVPVVVLCHLKRRDGLSAKDEPRLTDFAFSAAVERMARVALALSKPSDEVLRVHVLKQTNGIAGMAVDLQFNGPAGVVTNTPAPETQQAMAKHYGDGQ